MANSVSFSAPNDYSYESDAIARQRAYADLLRQQAMEVPQGQMAGKFYVKPSPIQGLAKVFQGYVAGQQQEDADTKQKALGLKYQTDLADVLTKSNTALIGTPYMPGANPATPNDDEGNVNPAVAPSPAVPGNPLLAAQMLMGHPATQALGMTQIGSDMSRRALVAALGGVPGTSTGQSTPAGSAAPAGAPGASTGMQMGGPAGGVPMAAWLQGDPTGKSYLEQLAKDNQANNQPVINRGFGVGRMVNGAYVPDAASGRQAAETAGAVEGAKLGAAAPFSMQQMEVPIYLPGGDQIKVKMNAMQAHAYQTTGQLPPEIAASIPGLSQPGVPNMPASGAAPNIVPPSQMPPQPPGDIPIQNAAFRAGQFGPVTLQGMPPGLPQGPGTAPGRPVIGRGQSQAEEITQDRQRTAGNAVDKGFGEEYVKFATGGGAADAAKGLSQLNEVLGALNRPKAMLSGPMLGSMPDMVKKFTNPGAIAMRERVEDVAQRSMRAILGGQFAEKEGENVIKRAYNQNLSEPENAIRVGRLFEQLKQAYEAKQSATRYFEQNGTLQGWKGKLPSMGDFDPQQVSGAISGLPSALSPAEQTELQQLRARFSKTQ